MGVRTNVDYTAGPDRIGLPEVSSTIVTVDNASSAPPPDTTNPTVTITSPSDGSTASGTVTIAVNASDDSGIDRAVFNVGPTEIGQVVTPPFEQAWDTTAFPDGANQVTAVAVDLSNNSQSTSITVTVSNASASPCTVYSCPSPPPPPTEPPPPPEMPSGSSPDGEFESVLDAKDMEASTITIMTEDGPLTLKITSETEFAGSIVSNISELLVGHVVQGEFFQSTKEIVWIEADMPPGL